MSPPSAVRVVSRCVVKPPPRPRERIPLTSWDTSFLSMNYIQKGLLFARPPLATADLLDHLHGSLADALGSYYPVAGRLATERHQRGDVAGCSVSIDCGGHGAEILHAVADGVAVADVVPPGDVPRVVQSFFPLDGAVSYDGHELPLFALQVTELADGVFLGFACNHALADGAAFWNFLNAWAEIARARLAPPDARGALTSRPPLLERWSPDGGDAAPAVLPCADPSALVERLPAPPMRERMLHFSEGSVSVLKERARQELLAAGDAAGASAVTRFQALASFMWRCFARAWRRAPDEETVFRAAIDNRGRLRPPVPGEYFGNCISSVTTGPVRASELLARGHGWAAAAVGRAVAAHTDPEIRARAAAWAAEPTVYTRRWFRRNDVFIGSSPRFDMYGCDFGWGKALAVRSGRANKVEGKASLFPGRDGGIDVEVVMTPENMAALEQDEELRAAVSPP
ncbi:uncharacterized acetyltransferase At3g50280-like [Panicum virgatum]|uniref:Acetyltransferase n=1 Tax=Panicum virgatum TaxID=38727 RepID=A0A8T0V2P9_PANVG|nr:uncharacterized acetyltransferase At3g50280-like [Panicum virgatum]KAG2627766.1 hypothetical protein PVAP13_3KG262831 [Panicum virgatum]